MNWRENPALRRYTYLPLTFLLPAPAVAACRAAGLPYDGRIVPLVGLLAAAAALGSVAPAGAARRAVVAAALLDPVAIVWGGEGDIVGLAFLPFAFLGRYLHPNHLAPVVPLLALGTVRRRP